MIQTILALLSRPRPGLLTLAAFSFSTGENRKTGKSQNLEDPNETTAEMASRVGYEFNDPLW
jgi:hypothetical protein